MDKSMWVFSNARDIQSNEWQSKKKAYEWRKFDWGTLLIHMRVYANGKRKIERGRDNSSGFFLWTDNINLYSTFGIVHCNIYILCYFRYFTSRPNMPISNLCSIHFSVGLYWMKLTKKNRERTKNLSEAKVSQKHNVPAIIYFSTVQILKKCFFDFFCIELIYLLSYQMCCIIESDACLSWQNSFKKLQWLVHVI